MITKLAARIGASLLALVALPGALLIPSCAEPKPLAYGVECTQATECQDGLACVPQRGGKRICTNDLEGLGRVPERPAEDAGASDAPAEDASPEDASPADVVAPADVVTPPEDAASD